MGRERQSIEGYLEERRKRGTLGTVKGHTWQGREIRTGYCPCPDCDHEVMIECDPDYDDAHVGCRCCHEVCT